jgi:F-box/WD-40 domain protein MET30
VTPTNDCNPLVIAGCSDSTAVIWDLLNCNTVGKLLNGHKKDITCVAAYSPKIYGKNAVVVTGSYDETAVIWNLHTREILHKLCGVHGHKKGITSIAVFHPVNGLLPMVITGSIDYSAKIWNLETGEYIGMLEDKKNGHTDLLLSIAIYAPENKNTSPIIVTASWDKTVIYWDLNEQKMIRKLTGHTKSVTSVIVFDPLDGTCPLVITTSLDKTIVIWDFHSGERIRVLKDGHTEKISSAVTIPS